MERYSDIVEQLRDSVIEGTRQVEEGWYYTDAQVSRMLDDHYRQLA